MDQAQRYYKQMPILAGARDPCEGCVAETDDDLCETLDCEPGWIYKRTYKQPDPKADG